MSGLLHLAALADLDRLEPMVAQFHAETGIESTPDSRRDALTPLLDGAPHGAIWLIGPKMAPVGYIVVSFGWSIELGGMDGLVDELWIREAVRGRGMGFEALTALQKALVAAGLNALSLEVAPDNAKAQRLYQRAGFRLRGHQLMTWRG